MRSRSTQRRPFRPQPRRGAPRTFAYKPDFEDLESRTVLNTNLIYNGDFELGPVGFKTEYLYERVSILAPATCALTTDPLLVHQYAVSYGDHTSGSGLMLAANGALTPGVVVWSQRVAVEPNTPYLFFLWGSSFYPLSPAQLDIVFNDTSIGIFNLPGPAGIWELSAAAWFSGDSSSLSIKIIDRNTGFSGNDFAIDDLSLYAYEGLRPLPWWSAMPDAIMLETPISRGHDESVPDDLDRHSASGVLTGARDVADLLAGVEPPPALAAGWQELSPVVIGAVRQQSVHTVEERLAVRPQTAVTVDSRPSRNGSDGGAWREEWPGEATWVVL